MQKHNGGSSGGRGNRKYNKTKQDDRKAWLLGLQYKRQKTRQIEKKKMYITTRE